MNLLNASMTPEQFQQYQQEQQQAFFRWQQSQVLNREFQDLQQNPPSFNSETSQSLTQPQQVDSPKKGGRKKTKSKRGKNVEDEPQEPVAAGRWLPVEEELLATCYVAVSEDNNVGRSQKHETFWYRVLNEFNSKIFQKRTKYMLTSKWHTLNANCQKFNAAYKRAKRLGTSGENDVDLMKRAQSIYRDDHKGVSFSQEDAFFLVMRTTKTIMGYKMDGCMSNMTEIIESQGVKEVNFMALQETKMENNDYFVMIRGVWCLTGNDLLIIAVYAPHDCRDKQMLWDYLTYEIGKWKGEVVIMGDFNEVCY
ncbi:transposon ty3-I gag-pol polyprotein [Tanacetum coccineum]